MYGVMQDDIISLEELENGARVTWPDTNTRRCFGKFESV